MPVKLLDPLVYIAFHAVVKLLGRVKLEYNESPQEEENKARS